MAFNELGFDVEKLSEIAKPRSAQACEKAEWRRQNKDWLRMSQDIVLCLDYYLSENGMTQKELAEAMKVSPAYVSKLLKGQENLTLEMICKLQKTIGQELITIHRPYEYRQTIFMSPTTEFSYNADCQIYYNEKDTLKECSVLGYVA